MPGAFKQEHLHPFQPILAIFNYTGRPKLCVSETLLWTLRKGTYLVRITNANGERTGRAPFGLRERMVVEHGAPSQARKGSHKNHQKWMIPRGFSTWGIKTGSFAAL